MNMSLLSTPTPASFAEKRIALEELTLTSNFDFSQLFNNINGSNADQFIFDNVNISLNVGSTTTSTFTGDLKMSGLLAPFKAFLSCSDTLAVTASIETTHGLTQKINPTSLTLSGVVPFHLPLFSGVTLTNVTLQLLMTKTDDVWTFVPSLIGLLDVDGLTDADAGKIKLKVLLEDDTLQLIAAGTNITNVFGLPQLMLDTINITGAIEKEKQLTIASTLNVGETAFTFNGVISPTAIGMLASVSEFSLNLLAEVFREVSPGNLALPDFNVDFNSTTIGLATADCSVGEQSLEKGLSLKTELTAHEHTITATADITPTGVSFSGAIENITVGSVTLDKAALAFDIYKRVANKPSLFCLQGEANIQNVMVDAGIYFEKQAQSWITVLYASVTAKRINLSTFFPATKGSVMDQLALSQMSFVFASADCSPQLLPSVSSVKKGLQLIAVVKEIPGLNELTQQENLDMALTAHIGDTVDISVALADTQLDLGNSVTTEPIKIALYIAPTPSIALIFGMEVSIPNQSQPLHFDMMLDISPIEATGSVTMKNYWRNPFGINGLKIGPAVAMQLGINYAQFAASGTPSTFGLAGGLAIGETIMDMAVNISTNPMDEILSGSLQELALKDIVTLATDTVGLNIPEDEIPDFLEIKNLQLYVAPAGGTIGTITYEKGMSFACDMVFMGKSFQFYTRISDNGIEGAGTLDAIDIGPLKICGEQGGDVSLGLALTPSEQSFHLDGAISFLGVKKGAYVDVSTKGVEFKFEENFVDLLKFQIAGKSSGVLADPSSLDFQLSADMKNDITHFLKTDVANKINDALNAATDDIDSAQKKVDDAERVYRAEYDKAEKALNDAQDAADEYLKKLQADVAKVNADYKREVGKAQKELDQAKAVYNKAFEDAKKAVNQAERAYNAGLASAQEAVAQAESDYNAGISSAQSAVKRAQRDYKNSIGSAQSAVQSAQRSVNSLKSDIKSTKRTINNLSWYETGKMVWLGPKLAGLYTAYGTATAALAAANGVLEGIKQGGAFIAFQSAQAALQLAKTGAKYTAFTVAKETLKSAKTGAKYTAFEGAKATLTAVQYGTQYTAWQAADQALSVAKTAGSAAISSANQAMNAVGTSSVYIALHTAEGGLKIVESGTSAVAFGSAKAALAAAKAGSKAVLGLAEFIANHAGDIIDVKSMHLSGSLKAIEQGDLFKAELTLVILGSTTNCDIDLDIKDIASFIDQLFEKAFDEAKSIAGF